MDTTQIGIVGYGSFGRLFASLVSEVYPVKVLDSVKPDILAMPSRTQFVESYEDFADCRVIFIATGLDSIELVCRELRSVVSPGTIVADVCSVKMLPTEIMQRTLADSCCLLATHPLFGPQTVLNASDVKGQKIVWHTVSGGDFSVVRDLFEKHLGIKIVELDPEAHDQEMAWVHGLTFFAGRALLDMRPPKSTLGTNYYQKLIDLVAVESEHSEELFMTIQRGNPFTDKIRQQFMETLQKYEQKIKDTSQ